MKDNNFSKFNELNKRWRAVWRKLDAYSKGCFPFYGWDMPTMRIEMPECATELDSIRKEWMAEVQLLKSAGLLRPDLMKSLMRYPPLRYEYKK